MRMGCTAGNHGSCQDKAILRPSSSVTQGVSDASERPGFFRQIMDSNVPNIAKAYADAEALFGQLQVCCSAALCHRTQQGDNLALQSLAAGFCCHGVVCASAVLAWQCKAPP